MGKWRMVVQAALLIGLAALLPTLAVAKVTLDKGGSAEVVWYGDDPGEEYPCACGDGLSVELSTFFEGDWAAVLLDCANRFTIDQITYLDFSYRHLEPQTNSGPRMALLLEKEDPVTGQITYYLAVSEAALPQTSSSCVKFSPTDWWYGEWDGSDFASYQGDETTTFTGPLWTSLPTDLVGAYVSAVAVFMGVVDESPFDGTTMGGDDEIEPGKVIVDCVTIKWDEGPVTHGGTYNLEPLWPATYNFDDTPDLAQWDDWTATGQWNLVNVNDLYGETGVAPFPSGEYAAYFGTADPNTGEGSYNGSGSREYGCLTSPDNYLNPGDRYVTISFDYFREVEQYQGVYPDQVYDWTYVQIKFNGSEWAFDDAWVNDPWGTDDKLNGWKTIWYKDSSDPNEGEWTHVDLDSYPDADGNPDPNNPIEVPPDATKVWIRFCFDSVDGYDNDHLGWLIDNVQKIHAPEPFTLKILTDSLPQAMEKVEYFYVLTANKPGVRWSVVEDPRGGFDSLPPRLALESGTGVIYGHPEVGTAGTYTIKIRAEWGSGHDYQMAEKVFYLAVRTPGSPIASNVIAEENFDPPSGGQGWTGFPPDASGLWHQTPIVMVDGTDIVTGQYVESAYFGQDDSTNPNYDTGGRIKGCLISPYYPIPAEFAGEPIIIGFKSWREVEHYDGAYDKTWVDIRFEGGDWKTVWYKDSRDPSERMWTWEEVNTGIRVPDNLPKLQIRFCFDSVDGYNNDFVGWLVDEVTIYAGSTILTIVNECPLPDGSVGAYYQVELKASGGPDGRREWEVQGDLPPGLSLREDVATGKWYIEGVPREAGTFGFKLVVNVKDGTGQLVASASKDCSITISEQVVLLYEDFENDPDWAWAGLWHRTYDTGVVGVPGLGPDNHAAYYGQDDGTNPNYDTGTRTAGTLTLVTPVIDLTGTLNGVGPVEAVKLIFDYWREVESFDAGYDFTKVQIKFNNTDWITIWEEDSSVPSEKTWITVEDIPAVLVPDGATSMLIRFAFDSVDKWFNAYTGWLVDNIIVQKAPIEGAQPLTAFAVSPQSLRPRDLAELFTVRNVPNPVTDVHTTTFVVRGVEAEQIKVEIYDLTGRLVWQGEAAGNEVEWHTDDLTGAYLANGVYLYKVYVKVGGEWIVSKVQKLVILR